MPCRYNTFDGRLLWFDGVESKRGLTLTVVVVVCLFVVVVVVVVVVLGGGRGVVKLFHCIVRTGVYGILCA